MHCHGAIHLLIEIREREENLIGCHQKRDVYWKRHFKGGDWWATVREEKHPGLGLGCSLAILPTGLDMMTLYATLAAASFPHTHIGPVTVAAVPRVVDMTLPAVAWRPAAAATILDPVARRW